MTLLSSIKKTLAARYKTGVVFIHTPKCGGSSVEAALQAHYRFSNERIYPIETMQAAQAFAAEDEAALQAESFAIRKRLVAYALARGVKCVTGHNPFEPKLFEQYARAYKFVTVLRDPVERFCSAYRYHKDSGVYAQIDESIEAFMATRRARLLGATYVAYFSGVDIRDDLAAPDVISQAIKTLSRFDVVGFLDRMAEFQKKLSDALGARIAISHLNKTSDRNTAWRGDFSDAQIAAIRDICAPDITVYEAARGLKS